MKATAIIGLDAHDNKDLETPRRSEASTATSLDAHDNKDLETPVYYNRAIEELKTLKIQRVDRLSLITNH